MANLGFKRAPFMVLFAALPAWTAVMAAENNRLRGRVTTQIEGELLDLSTVTPPPPYVPEDIVSNNSTMDSQEAEGRIIDGEIAVLDKYKFFVWVKGRGCGATHIEAEWIITAAHCDFRGGDSINIGGALATYDNKYATIAECFPHPEYTWPSYDYSVCRLTEPIYNRQMARLADAEYELEKDQPLTVIGKGRIKEGGEVAGRLMEAIVPYWEKEDCKQKLGGFKEDNMICAGGGSTDACQGDSGGPLLYEENGKYYVVGIVSWGSGCGREGWPGVYADVINQRSWIDETICNNSVNSVASICGGPLEPPASPSLQPSTSPSSQPSPEPESDEEDSHESTEVNCVDEGGVHYYQGHPLECSQIIEQMCVPLLKRKCPKTCDDRCK